MENNQSSCLVVICFMLPSQIPYTTHIQTQSQTLYIQVFHYFLMQTCKQEINLYYVKSKFFRESVHVLLVLNFSTFLVAQVEAILSQHPGVSGIVVVGLPDTRLTEMVVACVQLRDNWRWSDSCFDPLTENKSQILSGDILLQLCREKHLTRYFSVLNHASHVSSFISLSI